MALFKKILKSVPLPAVPAHTATTAEALFVKKVRERWELRLDERLLALQHDKGEQCELEDLRRLSLWVLDVWAYWCDKDSFYRDTIFDLLHIIQETSEGREPDFNRMNIGEWIIARDVAMDAPGACL